MPVAACPAGVFDRDAETGSSPVLRAGSLPISAQIAESIADSRPDPMGQTAAAEGAHPPQARAFRPLRVHAV